MAKLVFLKLGGSLITEKDQARTPRLNVITRLAAEIAAARAQMPGLRLLVGHGSGSFGHIPAKKFRTREGVSGQAAWQGFAEVWREARALNQLVVESLASAGLPVIAFPPSAFMQARDGQPAAPDFDLIFQALEAGLLPLVNGDAVFDSVRGGTIFSTEDVFTALAAKLPPNRILLAGIDAGVFADFPACQHLIAQITSDSASGVLQAIHGSASVDVTGGMREKVDLMLKLTRQIPGLQAQIFSGAQPGNLQAALTGAPVGTRISA